MSSVRYPSPVERAAVQAMRAALARDFAALAAELERVTATPDASPAALGGEPTGSAFDMLARLYGLAPLERGLLCLAGGAELDPAISALVIKACGTARADVTVALRLFGPEAWDALCPAAVLRRCRLLEVTGSGPFLQRRIEIDERMLYCLMGLAYLDPRLDGIVSVAAPPPASGQGSTDPLSARIVDAWSVPVAPVLLLAASDPGAARRLMAEAAAGMGMGLFVIAAADIPADARDRQALARLIDRELALSAAALLIESPGGEPLRVARLAGLLSGLVAISGPDPEAPERGPRMRIDIPAAGQPERRGIWVNAIGAQAEALGADLDRLAGQFALDGDRVAAAVESAVNGAPVAPDLLMPRLWAAARVQGRRRLDGLAQRIETRAEWDDLVLPRAQKALLRDLADHVREAWRVGETWGWAAKTPRGLGAAALFAGPSGTGKTFAAEVLANVLALDLYRIDLSQVVSKYIGETEKNLARIFAAAEDGGAILLFDEADALFGKRSEVRDSHDRYANVEVSYLLQQMEAYRGLAILTTNQKSALDGAFLRRLRYVLQFPFPDAAARAEIWARIFPRETPVEGLDLDWLAPMSLSGGSIRSVALNACFLAAGAGGPVRPEHIQRAAQREFAKLEKPMAATDVRRPS